MIVLRQLVIFIGFLLTFSVLPHQAVKQDLKFYLVNSKGLDYQFAGKADAHRFGVELKENRQFHHTITAEDGVRLGCYGFTLEGKKYGTNYIADGKGYRLAPTDSDLITVYSKGSDEPRIASFVESFNEEEIKAANIRYLFPDGCQAPTILYDPNNPSSSYENRKKLFESLIEKHQKAKNEENNKTTDRSVASRALKAANEGADDLSVNGQLNKNDNLNNNNHNNHNSNSDNNNNGNNNNGNNNNSNQSSYKNGSNNSNNKDQNGNNYQSLKNQNGYNYEANKNVRGSTFDCCNNDRIQIILPQNDSCSKNTAKLIIPLSSEKLSSIPITDFANLQSSTSISFVLKELQYLVEKYKL